MNDISSCLWITGGQAVPGEWDDLRIRLLERGVVVEAMTAGGPGPFGARLDRAREKYASLAKRYGRAAVAGVGAGSAMALILAEQYPVSALILLAPVVWPKPQRGADRSEAAYRQLATRNLFAIIAPTLIAARAGDELRDQQSARKLFDGMPHRDRKMFWLGDGLEPGAADDARSELIDAIIAQLRPTDDTNSLAN